MRPWLRGQRVGMGSGPLWAALAAVLLVIPSSASAAGCSGYVHSGAHPDREWTIDLKLGAPWDGEVTLPETPGTPEPPSGPCTGPTCSRQSDLPAPAPLPVPQRIDRWGVLAAQLPPPDGSSSPWWPAEVSSRPISAASAVFHPPRRPA